MSLTYMTGVGIGRKSRKERQAARKERREKRKEKRKERRQRVAKIALAPARATFLLAVSKNAMKLAQKLARAYKKDKSKLLDFWKKFGGQEDKLIQAIEKGIKAKLAGLGVVGLAAGLGAALPIIMKVLDLLKNMGVISKEEEAEDDKDVNDAKTNLELDPNTEKDNIRMPEDNAGNTESTALLTRQPPPEETEEKEDTGGSGKTKRILLIAGGVAAAAVLVYAISKRKPQQ